MLHRRTAASAIIGIISPSRRCHSYKTIQSTPAPTRRHTPKLSAAIRFRKARQTNAQPGARHTPAPKHAQADGEGRAPARDPNRCQTKRYPENSSFQTRRHLVLLVYIMPIMVLSPPVSGRCLWRPVPLAGCVGRVCSSFDRRKVCRNNKPWSWSTRAIRA